MKHLFLCLVLMLSFCKLYAVPANPKPMQVKQPDGNYVTLKLHGDEFGNFTTTEDGYTVMKNDKGFYSYALIENDVLIPSSYIAHDKSLRTPTELNFLKSINTYAIPEQLKVKANTLRAKAQSTYSYSRSAIQPKKYDISNFKGLVILVEYNDKKFSRTDCQSIFTDMINKTDYTGFTSEDGSQTYKYTGSVRDYFNDNSMGKFDPQFDVVGPISVNYSCEATDGTSNYGQLYALSRAVLLNANSKVNYSDYDNDKDGVADLVFIIYAGHGSNVTGNNTKLMWPHAGHLTDIKFDNVYINSYACSTEFGGAEGDLTLDGIGTICHEFSHVLGLWDEYDVDYTASNGYSLTPGNWSIMSGGNYLNNARTPCSYTLFQRYSLGWAPMPEIKEPGTYTLEDMPTSNTGFRLASGKDKEYFTFENRQGSKWDKYLPGNGMLVFRVDSTSTEPWANNALNIDPNHNYLELIRANPGSHGGVITNSAGDPFPGTGKVTSITNNTTPALKSWTGALNELVIENITSENGIVSIEVAQENSQKFIEDFESMGLSTSNSTASVTGTFADWKLTSAKIIESTTTAGDGSRALGMVSPSLATIITPINYKTEVVKFDVWNPTTTTAVIRLYYSTSTPVAWEELTESSGLVEVSIAPNTNKTLSFSMKNDLPVTFRISQKAGNATNRIYIDNFTVYYTDQLSSGVDDILTNENEKAEFSITDRLLQCPTNEKLVTLYTVGGQLILNEMPTDGIISLSNLPRGLYIVRQGEKAQKIIL